MQSNGQSSAGSFIKVEKTFHLTRMRTTTTLTDCSKLQASSLELQCAKSIPYHQSPAPRNQKKSPQKSAAAAAAALIFPDIPCTEFYTTPEKLDVTLVGELFLGIEG